MENNKNQQFYEQEEEINLRELLGSYLSYWKWFVLSVILALGLAFIYLKYTSSQYNITAKILLKEDDAIPSELASLQDLTSFGGGGEAKGYILDQIEVLRSRRLMTKVINEMQLNVRYFKKDGLLEKELFLEDSPIKIVFLNQDKIYLDTINNSFQIEINSKTSYKYTDEETSKEITNNFGSKLSSEIGELIIIPNKAIETNIGEVLTVTVNPMNNVIDQYIKNIQIDPNDTKNTNVVKFSLTDNLKPRATKVIDKLINQYNADINYDRSRITATTSQFINDRLKIITEDLQQVDQGLESFKTHNKITDVASEMKLSLQKATDNEQKLLQYSTQLSLIQFMDNHIKNNQNRLLPSNVGLEDRSIEETTAQYNKLVLEKEDLLKSSTEANPVVQNLNKSIRELNNNLRVSLRNYQSATQLALNQIQSQTAQIESKSSQLPKQERLFRDVSRQQQIVETLYLFLLQKREENEIKAAATPDNIKVIDSAYGSNIPVAPKKPIILLAALLLGGIIPFGILYIKFLLDNKVHDKRDIEKALDISIIGEIPKSDVTIIGDQDRSSVAEAFRILRTNLDFMLSSKRLDSKVIFVTSTVSGEGKTFISSNLSKILALSGKRVLMIGADVRKPKILDYLELNYISGRDKGVVEYLIDDNLSVEDIIIKPKEFKFHVIHSGIIPPNPSELMMNGRFSKILEYGKNNYDYIIVDTAPVSLVTDTLLIADQADLTLYICRANYLPKQMLNIPKTMQEEKKLLNMTVLLNEVDMKGSYGYGYGYSDYIRDGKLSWWYKLKRIFTE